MYVLKPVLALLPVSEFHFDYFLANSVFGDDLPHFPVSTLYLYPGVYAPPLPLLHSEDWVIQSVDNPYPDAVHFNDQEHTLTYFGEFSESEKVLKIVLERNNNTAEVSLTLKRKGLVVVLISFLEVQTLPNGVQTCVMKEPLDVNVTSYQFVDSNIDFCYENEAFSFTHEDPRT